MNRRQFLCDISAITATAMGVKQWDLPVLAEVNKSEEKLEGFIVSDAHFGWVNKQQPSQEEQRRAMQHIRERFPNLDVFIDTGDAHHGNLRGNDGDVARRDWLDIIANGAGPIPFLYVPGNHEIEGAAEGDQEERCCRLGSLSCRPYYSYDIKGIHFVSVPEMVRAVYITREMLEWLALDLRVHKDKTTILLSHNHILDTTGPFEAGYRGIVNSAALLQLFMENPQVIAWMHGHNHNYELVQKDNVLYVSNGRIGGFDPSSNLPEGSHGLGGMYFALTASGLTVRSYSATRGCFLDEINLANASAAIETKTSFSPDAPSAHSYGYGGARNGLRIPVKHHVAGAALSRSIYVSPITDAVFNDDPDFTLYTARNTDKTQKQPQQMLMGSEVKGAANSFTWDNPGITILPPDNPKKMITFSVPKGGEGQVKYYRCAPEHSYIFRLHIHTESLGVLLRMRAIMTDTNGTILHTCEQENTLVAGDQVLTMKWEIPALPDSTIYTNADSDIQTQLIIANEISGLDKPLRVMHTELRIDDAASEKFSPEIRLIGKTHTIAKPFSDRNIERLDAEGKTSVREVVECFTSSNQRITWLIREQGPDVQVRNAVAYVNEDWLEVGPIRAEWLEKPVIIIAPLSRLSNPHVFRLNNISSARIRSIATPLFSIEVANAQYKGDASIELVADKVPDRIEGGEVISLINQHLIIKVNAPDMVIRFDS